MRNSLNCWRLSALTTFSFGLLSATVAPAIAQHYRQTDLVADQSGVAMFTDPNLVNPWGLSRSSGSPWWISDNGTGLSTLYDGTGAAKSLVVTVPTGDPTLSSTGTPTGTLFNGTQGFATAPGKPSLFLFVTEDGTISGWNPGVNATNAVITVNTKSASVFKGAAFASITLQSGSVSTFLYAADFRKGRVLIYDSSFNRVSEMEDSFRDENLPDGYAPFNIQNIGGDLYVTFAKQDDKKHDEVDGAGLGFLDVFSPTGRLVRRFEHGSWLNAPWALAMAPGDFGVYSHDLLVGQFGSGNIAVYDSATGRFKGLLRDSTNTPIAIGGLWALSFGSDGGSGPATSLYFSAGSDGEQHGLFGTITPIENTLGNEQ
jgi:uncharacterized protein (TIGR03118 family)